MNCDAPVFIQIFPFLSWIRKQFFVFWVILIWHISLLLKISFMCLFILFYVPTFFLSISLSLSLYFLLSYFDHSTPEVSEKFPKYFQFLALLPFLPIFSIYLSSQSLACIFHLNLICGMSVTLLLLYLKLRVCGISRSLNNMFHMRIRWHLYVTEQDVKSVIKLNEGMYFLNIIPIKRSQANLSCLRLTLCFMSYNSIWIFWFFYQSLSYAKNGARCFYFK